MQIKVMNDKEPRITLIQDPNSPAAIMLVGNTDIMIFGNERNGQNGDLVAEVTEIRAKKKPNANAGPLKDRLAKIPDKAVAMLVGEIPLELKREFGGALDPWPRPRSPLSSNVANRAWISRPNRHRLTNRTAVSWSAKSVSCASRASKGFRTRCNNRSRKARRRFRFRSLSI